MKYLITLIALTNFAFAADKEKFQKIGTNVYKLVDKQVNLVNFVKGNKPTITARNEKATPALIKTMDDQWRAWKKGGAQSGFIKTTLENPCTEKVRTIMGRKQFITEVFVMNNVGETICAYPATSDYDQGDEAKWWTPFKEGKVHVSDPEMDPSSKRMQSQVSFPIKEGGKAIGVITIGVRAKN